MYIILLPVFDMAKYTKKGDISKFQKKKKRKKEKREEKKNTVGILCTGTVRCTRILIYIIYRVV